MTTPQFVEPVNTVVPQRISSSGATQLTGDSEHRACFRPGSQHRRPTVQVAQHGHRQHPLGAADEIATDDARADPPRLVPHAVDERVHVRRPSVTRCSEADHECRGPRAHRLDVGGVLGDRLTADVVRRRPVQPEMPILHEHVGRYHGATVPGRDDRRVVAGPQYDRSGLPTAAHHPVDHRELTELLQRRGLFRRPGRIVAHATSSGVSRLVTTASRLPDLG